MSNVSEWAERCQVQGIRLYRLEHESDVTALFQTKEQIGNGIPCYNWTTPVYHVWIDDKNVVSTTNYREAYGIYDQRRNER